MSQHSGGGGGAEKKTELVKYTPHRGQSIIQNNVEYLLMYPVGRGSFSSCWVVQPQSVPHNSQDPPQAKRSKRSDPYVVCKISKNNSTKSVDMWTLETSLLKKCNHRHIITLYDSFISKVPMFTMEWCTHGSLTKRIQTASLQIDEICKYTYQLLDAVQYLHSIGIVHRDIKPNNVLLSTPNLIKLCDFGLATEWKRGMIF